MSVRKGMPKKIKIGAIDFDVKLVDTLKNDEGKDAWGLYSETEEAIFLSKEIPSFQADASTLIHEILHGIHSQMAMGGTQEQEEKLVSLFSNGLNAVFRDNPELIKYIQWCYK